MSKKYKSAQRDKRKLEKRNKKEARQKQYQSWRDQGINGKSKRFQKQEQKASWKNHWGRKEREHKPTERIQKKITSSDGSTCLIERTRNQFNNTLNLISKKALAKFKRDIQK